LGREQGPTTRNRSLHSRPARRWPRRCLGEEEEIDVADPGRFRRTGVGNKNELGGRRQCQGYAADLRNNASRDDNLKGKYVKALKDAASYITTAWKDQSTKRTGPGHNSGTASTRLADARLTALEEENAALRQELSRRPACAHECPQCSGSVPAPGLPRGRVRATVRALMPWRRGSMNLDHR
jgi:hypothetical protein